MRASSLELRHVSEADEVPDEHAFRKRQAGRTPVVDPAARENGTRGLDSASTTDEVKPRRTRP